MDAHVVLLAGLVARGGIAYDSAGAPSYLRNISSDAEDPDDILFGVKFGVSTYLL